jgi:serine/threonine protein kinase
LEDLEEEVRSDDVQPAIELDEEPHFVEEAAVMEEAVHKTEGAESLGKNNDFSDLYDVGLEVKQGTYVHATAYECTERATGEARIALRFAENRMSTQTETKSLLYECVVLQQLIHDSIIKSFGFFEKAIGDHKHYFIILEKVPNGLMLLEHIEKRPSFNESDVALIVETLLKALSFAHEKSHVHGDIRPENIIIGKDAALDTLKLTGFAPIAHDINEASQRFGSAGFTAPEDINGEIVVEKALKPKKDLWAVGVLAFMLLCGKAPF